MPKSTLDAYGTYALPYLRPPDVPGASRCALTFDSQEVLDKKDFYRGKKRYRFNKWRPVSPHFPRLHSSGLIFSADQDAALTGFLSPWVIPSDSTGTVKLVFMPTVVDEFDFTDHNDPNRPNDHLEIGVGFSRYNANYWGLAQGCEFICKLNAEAPTGLTRTYSRLRNDVFQTHGYNIDKGTIFTLYYDKDTLGIIYDEFDPVTNLVTFSEMVTTPNLGGEYRILFYLYGMSVRGSVVVSKTLISTDINLPGLNLSTVEKVWFLENPSTFVPPFAPLRDTGLSMYAKPYRALIEDGQIMVGSPFTPPIWLRTLDFLTTGSVEPAVFTDPDGYEWLVCFSDLNASSAMEVGDNGMGYELTMPIVVAH